MYDSRVGDVERLAFAEVIIKDHTSPGAAVEFEQFWGALTRLQAG